MVPFSFQRGNKVSGCEDAQPVSALNYQIVCDGVGGSGLTKHTVSSSNPKFSGTHTSAYLGARIVARSVARFFENYTDLPNTVLGSEATDEARSDFLLLMKAHIISSLEEAYADFGITPKPSKTLKIFPTTLATAVLREDSDVLRVMSIWAGDSRVYALSPSMGLQMLSVDDAAGAEERMGSSSSMTNYIYRGGDFKLNYAVFEFREPCLVFCCSDGCFDFRKSPLHFELALLRGLLEGAPESDLASSVRDGLYRALCTEIGDDTTLAGTVFGFASCSELRDAFRQRIIELEPKAVAINTAILQKKQAEKEKAEATRVNDRCLETSIAELKPRALPALSETCSAQDKLLAELLFRLPCFESFTQELKAKLEALAAEQQCQDEELSRVVSKLRSDCVDLLAKDYVRYRCEKGSGSALFRIFGGQCDPYVDLNACLRALEALQGLYIRQEFFSLSSWYFTLPGASFERPSDLAGAMEASVRILRNSDCGDLQDLWAQSYYDTPSYVSEREVILQDPATAEEVEAALSDPAEAYFASGLTKARLLAYRSKVSERNAQRRGQDSEMDSIRANTASDFYDRHANEILDAVLSAPEETVKEIFFSMPELYEHLSLLRTARERLLGVDDRIRLASHEIERVWSEYRVQYELYKAASRKVVR